ncbi:ABC-type multidrug transport system, ATPase and permease component [Nocardioides scoriae]|uniref:ABC-type multidrug transport system, ATPase and permease component n=1 Tax=Nocardioides scoriae TaxID=642780 RepID=A0A1H1WZE1_9ACTN|nr:ABC-type multidrug transport system, ATPase and permease component [Nocardioides scoriae]
MAGPRVPPWRRAYRPFVQLERRRLWQGGALTVGAAVAEALGLAILGFAATRTSMTDTGLVLVAAGIGASLALSAVVRAAGERALASTQIHLERQLRHRLSGAVLGSDWQDFVDQPGHELQSALLAESPQVATATVTYVRSVASLASAAVVFVAAFVVSVPAAAVSAVFGIAIAYAYGRASRGLGEAQNRLADSTVLITRHTAILVNGLRSLRLSPVLHAWRADLDAAYDAQAAARHQDMWIPIRARLVVEVMGALMVFGVLAVQGAVSGDILPGLVVMAMILRVLPRLQAAQQARSYALHSEVWLRRWDARLDAVGRHALPSATAEADGTGAARGPGAPLLEFRDVSFHYRSHDTPVLDHVDLVVGEGEWTCLVGASGGGKSTLVDIAGGLLVPTRGRVLLRGRDLRSLDVDELHSQVVVVPQDIHLVGANLREALTWGGRLPTPERFDEICRHLGITEMFLHSSVTFDSKLDELGRDISGGMRTRLAIARALMSGPAVLVLDESTSRLPPATEAAIFEDIRRSTPDLAVVVVTHRHETAHSVGAVVRLESGRLVVGLGAGG